MKTNNMTEAHKQVLEKLIRKNPLASVGMLGRPYQEHCANVINKQFSTNYSAWDILQQSKLMIKRISKDLNNEQTLKDKALSNKLLKRPSDYYKMNSKEKRQIDEYLGLIDKNGKIINFQRRLSYTEYQMFNNHFENFG